MARSESACTRVLKRLPPFEDPKLWPAQREAGRLAAFHDLPPAERVEVNRIVGRATLGAIDAALDGARTGMLIGAGVFGLGAAIDYLSGIGFEAIEPVLWPAATTWPRHDSQDTA